MNNVYTWAAKPAKRSTTVGDLKLRKVRENYSSDC